MAHIARPDACFNAAKKMLSDGSWKTSKANACEFSAHIASLWAYVGEAAADLARTGGLIMSAEDEADPLRTEAMLPEGVLVDGILNGGWIRDLIIRLLLNELATPEVLDKIPAWLAPLLADEEG